LLRGTVNKNFFEEVSYAEEFGFDSIWLGDPAQCIEQVGLMKEQFGVTHFRVYMDLGGLEQRQVLKSMERFATRVMPHFR